MEINCTSNGDSVSLNIEGTLYYALPHNDDLPTGIRIKYVNCSSDKEENSTEFNIFLMISANWNATVTHIQCCYNKSNAFYCQESYSLLRLEIGGKDTHALCSIKITSLYNIEFTIKIIY